MFNLRRYFSLASAVAIVAVTVILVVLYDRHSMDELVRSAERDNVTLARAFANTIWPRFSSYVMSISGADGDALRARSETQKIHDALMTLTSGLRVLKVKIYNLDGLTVYSSQPSQIGADKSNKLGYLKSAQDRLPASKLSHRDTFSAFFGEVQDRDLVESYIPIWGPDGAIEGVFELSTDVTPLIARVRHGTIRLTIGLLLILGLLYGALLLIVQHADRILKKQSLGLLRSEESIKARNTILEIEVTERKRTEQALRASEARLAGTLDIAPDAVISVDQDQRDVSERKAAKKAMRVAKQQAELANAIIGLSEMIRGETFGPVGNHESGAHLLDLINDILDISKTDVGKTDLHETIIDVSRVLRICLTVVREHAESRDVEIDLDVAPNLPALRADERKLKKILINLLSNAIKFTSAGGRVTVRSWCRGDDGYVVQIADTGIGIALEDIPMALAPFGQIDSDLNRKYEGTTGLGLPLTKSLVEIHGGSLDLQSEVGHGTTVTVRFPAERIVASLENTDSLGMENRAAS